MSERKFWVVWNSNNDIGYTTVRHESYDSAFVECERLAKHQPSGNFYVLEAVAKSKGRVDVISELLLSESEMLGEELASEGYTAADAKLDGIPTEGESSLSASACYAVCYWDQKYDDHGIDGVYKDFVKACEVSRDFTKRTGIPSQVKQTTLIA